MKTFDVLDNTHNIHQNLLLEASAGTGKTFSIENIYVRLLIEEPAARVDQILVVTFTRAATSELRERIHHNVEQALYILKNDHLENAPSYLQNLSHPQMAKRRLEHALSDFDQACITTIHAFCEKTLKESAYLFDEQTESMNELVESSEVRKVIHDFFLTGLKKGLYSPEQLKRVLSYHQSDIKQMENALLNLITRGLEIAPTHTYEALFDQFCAFMQQAKGQYQSQKLLDDFHVYAPSFKNILNRNKEIKPDILKNIHNFCALFEYDEWNENHFETLLSEGLLYATLLDESLTKCKAALPDRARLHYPDFLKTLREGLLSVIDEARHSHLILGRMACDCQKLLHKFLHREEKYQYDDLLKKMLRRACGANFANRLRDLYSAVIIDEFQDTDPIQWGIFKQLFLDDPEKRSHLYLVGDPKQSIYAFRQADIYTYLSAAEAIGNDHVASLSTNYRSEPSLVDALNALFSEERIPQFFQLPRLKKSLACEQVFAGQDRDALNFHDEKKSLHFLIAKGKKKAGKWPAKQFQCDFFFSSIVNEMIRCKKECGIMFSQWAILMRDRYQAEEFAQYCERYGVPVRKQKQKSLVASPAYGALKEILFALNNPQNMSALKLVFGGCLVQMSPLQLKELDQPDCLIPKCEQWKNLREIAFSKGFSEFISQFLETKWNDAETLYEKRARDSEDLYHEFQQLCDLVSTFQHQQNASLLRCQQYCEELEKVDVNDDDALKCRQNPDHEACEILSIHMSKGLEYDIVVPLGLINRTPQKENFIPVQNDCEGHLVPIADQDRGSGK